MKSLINIKTLFFTFFLLLSFYGNSQNDANKGKEFWFGYMESNVVNTVEVYITYYDPNTALSDLCTITIRIPGKSWINTYKLENGHSTKVTLPTAFAYVDINNLVDGKAVQLTADREVEVRIGTVANSSVDATSILPLSAIPKGTQYYNAGYFGSSPTYKSQLLLVAPENNTEVEIIPSTDLFEARDSGIKFTVTLNRGQVYQLKSDGGKPLSGTSIKVINGCQKLVVFGGNQCTPVSIASNCQSCDLLMAQLIPTELWGTEYLLSPFKSASGGYVYQIGALKNNTQLIINGTSSTTLNAGQFTYIDETAGNFNHITANHPISVYQYMKSQSCFGHSSSEGDPSMIAIPPLHLSTKRSSVRIPHTPNLFNHWINIIVKSGEESLFKHNGVALSNSLYQDVPVLPGYKYAQIPINDSIQQLESDSGFYAISYGYGVKVSYGLSVTRVFEQPGYFFVKGRSHLCNNGLPIDFELQGDSAIQAYWLFNQTDLDSGLKVSKVIPADSTSFAFQVVVKNKNNACPMDTISQRLPVYEAPVFNLLPSDTTICLGERVDFSLAIPNVSYQWHNGSTSQSFFTRKTETVTLTLTDNNGCARTDTSLVRVSPCLDSSFGIPNIFTPNGDSKNDAFVIKHFDFEKAEGKIYNRWGQVVYEFTLPEDPFWNGKVNNLGADCPFGTYYYIINLSNSPSQQKRTLTGVITLLRDRK